METVTGGLRVARGLCTFVDMTLPRRPSIVSFRVSPKELMQIERCRRPDERLSECARRLLFAVIAKASPKNKGAG